MRIWSHVICVYWPVTTKYFFNILYQLIFSPFVSLAAQYPSFLSEPASLVQSHGSVAHLHCSASPPSALVSWRFRGLHLGPDTLPGVELSGGSLTISSLKPSHAGVYQCVARLDHGPAIASRHARVSIAGTDAENYPFVHTSSHFKERKEVAWRGRPFCECTILRKNACPQLLLSGGGKEAVGVFARAPFQMPLERYP